MVSKINHKGLWETSSALEASNDDNKFSFLKDRWCQVSFTFKACSDNYTCIAIYVFVNVTLWCVIMVVKKHLLVSWQNFRNQFVLDMLSLK